ncbi:MAG: hypothetical protein PHI42_06305 [Paludibacteraceae bacterium]|nr:hypothetical protein [Paludibacteraceae bacterium]
MAKTTIGFNVSQEVADRAKKLFPNGRTEDALITLLDLYENAGENKSSSDNEQYREIVESICNTYTIEPQAIIDFINAKNEAILEAERVNADLKDENRRFGTENGLLIEKNRVLEEQNSIQPKEVEKIVPINKELSPNQLLLDNVQPLERYLLEKAALRDGCSVKDLLVNRFFMVYQVRGNGDYKIPRFTSSFIEKAKSIFK